MKYTKDEVNTQTVFVGYFRVTDELVVELENQINLSGSEKWVNGRYGQSTIQIYAPDFFVPSAIYKMVCEVKYKEDKAYHRIYFSSWDYQKSEMQELAEPALVKVVTIAMMVADFCDAPFDIDKAGEEEIVYSAYAVPTAAFVERLDEVGQYITVSVEENNPVDRVCLFELQRTPEFVLLIKPCAESFTPVPLDQVLREIKSRLTGKTVCAQGFEEFLARVAEG